MNDLPVQIPDRPLTSTSSPISTRLWRLLSSQHASDTEVSEIVEDPELHAEAKAVCHALTLRAAAAGEAAVRSVLQPLVLVYGVGEAAKSPAFWQAYKILAGTPVEALKRGIEEYVAQPDSAFFPKPGPLKAFCDKHAEPIFKAAYRANKASVLNPPKVRVSTEAEREAIHKMAGEVAQSLALSSSKAWPERRIKPEDLPSIAGKADETGITSQMRDLLGRQSR